MYWHVQRNTETPETITTGDIHAHAITIFSIAAQAEMGKIKMSPKVQYPKDTDMDGDSIVTVGKDRDGPWVSVASLSQMKELALSQFPGDDELVKLAVCNTTSLQAAAVGKGFIRLFDVTTARSAGKIPNTHDASWSIERVNADPHNPHCILIGGEKGFVYYDLRSKTRAKTLVGDFRPIYTAEFAYQNPGKIVVSNGPIKVYDVGSIGTGVPPALHTIEDKEDDRSYESAAMYGNLVLGWIRPLSLKGKIHFYNLANADISTPVHDLGTQETHASKGFYITNKKIIVATGWGFGTLTRQ